MKQLVNDISTCIYYLLLNRSKKLNFNKKEYIFETID